MTAAIEDRWRAAEAEAEERRRRRARRQPLLLIGLLDVLVLAVGATALVDLRRLATPQGTALAWTQAAVFGDCGEYRRLSVPPSTAPYRTTDEQGCAALRQATREARTQTASIALRPAGRTVTGDRAVVRIGLERRGQRSTLVLDLARTGGRWRVVRDATSCAVLDCP